MILTSRHPFRICAVIFALLALSPLANLDRHAAQEPEVAAPRETAPHAPMSARAGFAGPIQADLLRVVDGDTFEARVRVWFGHDVRSLIRIRGFDAPEKAAACADEARRAEEATRTLQDVLDSGALTLTDVAPDKYFGRVVATVRVRMDDAETDVAAMMLAAGQGRPYAGGRRGGWCALQASVR